MEARERNSPRDDSDDDEGGSYDVPTWEQCAVEEQQQYYIMFGDRDYNSFRPSERFFLTRQVGFALFGPPQTSASNDNRYTGYDEKQITTLMDVVKTIEKCQDSIYETLLATVFVSLKLDGMPMIAVPVFRVPKFKGAEITDEAFLVDSNCRVYEDWNNYLNDNRLPACKCCYPWKGAYNGDSRDRVLVEFRETPAARPTGRLLSGADTASNVVALSAAGVTIASLAVPVVAGALTAAVVGGVVAGVYGVGRSIGTLVDRRQHRQDIGLRDAESRTSWLTMAVGVLGVGSGAAMQAVSGLAREGVAVGVVSRAAVTSLNIATLVVSGTGLLNGLHSLLERRAAGELTNLEIFQFSLSVFFFTHSVVNFQTASAVIQESQQGVISDFRKSLRSNRHRRELRRVVRETTRGMDGVEGRAKVIRALNQIDNKDAFFAGLARGRKEFAVSRAKITLTESGTVRINDKINVHPMKFRAINKNHRQVILDKTRALSKGEITRARFRNDVNPIFKQYKMKLSNARVETRLDLCQAFGVRNLNNIVIGGKRIFDNIKNVHMDNLSSLVECFGLTEMLGLAKIMIDKLGCSDVREFIDIVQFLQNRIAVLLSEMESAYQSALNDAQQNDVNFNRDNFDIIYNLDGDRIEYFLKTIFDMFKLVHNIKDLINDYTDFKKSNSSPRKGSQCTLSGIYYESRDFSVSGELSRNEIFFAASEVLGTPISTDNCELIHEDNMILVFCFGENIPARTVIIETNKQEGTVTAKEL